jgi:hypothetical protein
MAQTKLVSRTGESPDEKSKRMAVEVPERIATAREAARAVYDVVKPASERTRTRKAPKE